MSNTLQRISVRNYVFQCGRKRVPLRTSTINSVELRKLVNPLLQVASNRRLINRGTTEENDRESTLATSLWHRGNDAGDDDLLRDGSRGQLLPQRCGEQSWQSRFRYLHVGVARCSRVNYERIRFLETMAARQVNASRAVSRRE